MNLTNIIPSFNFTIPSVNFTAVTEAASAIVPSTSTVGVVLIVTAGALVGRKVAMAGAYHAAGKIAGYVKKEELAAQWNQKGQDYLAQAKKDAFRDLTAAAGFAFVGAACIGADYAGDFFKTEEKQPENKTETNNTETNNTETNNALNNSTNSAPFHLDFIANHYGKISVVAGGIITTVSAFFIGKKVFQTALDNG